MYLRAGHVQIRKGGAWNTPAIVEGRYMAGVVTRQLLEQAWTEWITDDWEGRRPTLESQGPIYHFLVRYPLPQGTEDTGHSPRVTFVLSDTMRFGMTPNEWKRSRSLYGGFIPCDRDKQESEFWLWEQTMNKRLLSECVEDCGKSCPPPPPTKLGEENEIKIVEHIKMIQKHGYAPTRNSVRSMAFRLTECLYHYHKFDRENHMAGYDWLNFFFLGIQISPSEKLKECQ
ncbi:hypothetical protein PR048_007871 [Dryococelus australis]|uniref:Uncharacterized protein n=1 Tax=Dryococelus australis TaxID=614101 RepID=A0ABQ9HWB5_9NEOP|nr:hypothetical protein PR048_007871 [Dryococelus australis]